ncbi:MAG: helix-turn-helix domain-containing protein, partial [Bacteroidales bacterium]
MQQRPLTDDQFLELINQIIEENIDNSNFSVENLAQDVGLSQSMLHRKLIKLTNKPAGDHITEIRLARAKELLEDGADTASSVAYRVGFKDPSYFNKVFKKRYNISPGNVRKSIIDKLIHLPTNRKSKIINFSKLKSYNYKLLLKVLIIILIIIIAGGEIYYFLRVIRKPKKSVAVLPLRNLTGHPENNYFVEGMHDALIGELSKIELLRVISRTSTLHYLNSDKSMTDIANELGVNTIVEGSVMAAQDSLRILIQLIDVFPKERHILANEYYDDMHNVLSIQAKAAKDIAQKIRIKLSKHEEQLLTKYRKVDPETYKAYLRGMYYLNQGTAESFETGINYMYKAIERDPADPFAYAGLALGYAIKGHGMIAPERSFRSYHSMSL